MIARLICRSLILFTFSKILSTDQFVQLFVHVGNVPATVELEHGTVVNFF